MTLLGHIASLLPKRRASASLAASLDLPFQAEVFGIERLEAFARTLAESDRIQPGVHAGRPLLARFQMNRKALFAAQQTFSDAARLGQALPTAAEWLLDNFYAVQGHLHDIQKHLSREYYRKLPKLAAGPYAGYPRVYAMALELLAHTDSRLDLEVITRFVQAYQSASLLSAGELWAVAIMLRIGLVENLRRLVQQALVSQQKRTDASRWADRLLQLAHAPRTQFVIAMADLSQAYTALDSVFVVYLLERLRDQSPAVAPVVHWLEEWLTEQGTSLGAVTLAENQQRAANRISVGNVVTSLRTLAAIDWPEFFESTSYLEAELRKDPPEVYAAMDFQTRDQYRHVVEQLSWRTQLPETEVVQRALAHARRFLAGHATQGGDGSAPGAGHPGQRDLREGHIGFYLLDAGRRELEADLGYRPDLPETVRRWVDQHASLVYLGSTAVLTVVFAAAALTYGARHGLGLFGFIALAFTAALPASALAVSVVNYLVTVLVAPQTIPKLALRDGIPADLRTMVVVPALISSETGVERLFDNMEIRFLGNRDPHLHFGLLGDFADAPHAHQPEDVALVAAAVRRVRELNERYGHDGQQPFYFFHRQRCWNAQEGVWMGWERKRGKLLEFNRLLGGASDTNYVTQIGDLTVLRPVRYVITLDADTELPLNSARGLVGAMAHPLNQPRIDPATRSVIDGYGILQPRLAVTALAAGVSRFSRLFAGESGLDPYSSAVSGVYQDLFRQGNYIGKAIYDVEAARAVLDNRFPDDLLLSHDLLEGSYVRAGHVTDIQLLEDFPSGYNAYMQRQHRWVRGDWQITNWLFPVVPGAGGRRLPNPLPLISRWRIFDNLRLSLIGPAVILLLLLAWTALPGQPLVWTVMALMPVIAPELGGLILVSGVHPLGEPWLAYFRGLARDAGLALGRVSLLLVFLLHGALFNLDAIGRVLLRRTITHRGLLEWNSAAMVEHGQARRAANYWARMWAVPVLALGLLALVAVVHPGAIPAALPLAAIWIASPFVGYWVSLPTSAQTHRALKPDARRHLRQTARRIWHFYEVFAAEEDHWLPPDNYQAEPGGKVAHRTSPTNIGFLLLSALAAYDFGYLDVIELANRLELVLATLDGLERQRGHFLNWYDTQSLQPLQPEYISTVDSGNLAACLLALKQACLQIGSAPVITDAALPGLLDTLAALEQAFAQYSASAPATRAPPAAGVTSGAPPAALPAARRLLELPETDRPGFVKLLGQLDPLARSIDQRAQALAGADGAAEPDELREWSQAFASQIRAWQRLTTELLPAGELSPADHLPSLQDLMDQSTTPAAAAAAKALCTRYQVLAARAEALAADMEFGFLFSKERGVFSIGYNLPAQRLDNSFYDLLASEARLASFVAIAQGQVPARHWFRLARPLAWAGGSLVALSWGGTMFEYLMPSLLMHDYDNSLLEQTTRSVVREQRRYGAVRRVPWGVSESGFYAFDFQLNYQYQSFGVPDLGLKRELGDNLVIAPYATFLALHVSPAAAWANLQRLAREGALGRYGYFEALDYTPARRPRGQPVGIVRSFMAHHQGMSLIALDNYFNAGVMRQRFHAEPAIAAVELLLQERMPRHVPLLDPHPGADAEPDGAPGTQQLTPGPSVRSFSTPHTATPRAHLMSNSAYEVMVTNAGGGYSAFHEPSGDQPLAITRWRPDMTCDDWGSFIYVQDLATRQAWSATYQPVGREAETYEVSYASDRAQFRRRDLGIETRLEIVVSPRDNAEIRQLTITNRSRRARSLAVTSYAEVVLAPRAADLAHPAFMKLFVESEFVPERQALLFHRRPRSGDEPGLWALHLLAAAQPLSAPVEYETDRARFIGRGRTARNPRALDGSLSNTVGAVLDPVMSLRCAVQLAAGETARLVFVTGIADTRENLLALADKFYDLRNVASALELAWVYSQIQLRHLNISEQEAHLFQRLASRILYPETTLRAPPEVLAQNTRGQSGLWAYGLSGDNPIVVVRVDEDDELDLVRQLLRAQAFWRLNHFMVDLVILNEDPTSYTDGLQSQVQGLIDSSLSQPFQDKPGGVFLRKADQIPPEDRILMQTVARVLLVSDQGSLAEQLDRAQSQTPPPTAAGRAEQAGFSPQGRRSAAAQLNRQFDNGLGGFSRDGREYIITLDGDDWTPAPWVNVLANENFGCLVSEAGLGYTWSDNSQQNRLTPWSNDPVQDPAGEALYVRDDETGQFWTPTPLPIRESREGGYLIAHGAGYTRYQHDSHGLNQELVVFVPADDPVKVMLLRLRNPGRLARRLTIIGYAEWVLGVTRAQSQYYVVSERDARSGALLARNRYNSDFGQRVAFAHLGRGATPAGTRGPRQAGTGTLPNGFTSDRAEFIGRNGSLARPAALERPALSGRVGAGLDPCAALQTQLVLKSGESAEIVFLLGEVYDPNQIQSLIARYEVPTQAREALDARRTFWDGLLDAVQVETPDPALNLMLNRWLVYQALACRLWGRSAFYQSGGAYGYRDQLQDILALLHAPGGPDLAREHLLRAAAHQFVEGDVQHWWHPTTGQGVRTRFSDDFLWLTYATVTYVVVTGDTAVLDEPAPYLKAPPLAAGQGEAFVTATPTSQTGSLYEHCVRALDHGLNFGPHGLPLMGIGDWNDGMNAVGPAGRGESVWLGWFLLTNLAGFADLAEARADAVTAERYRAASASLRQALEDHAWDGHWYLRAYFDDGSPLGSAQNAECQIDSIAQSWSVISGGAPDKRAREALEAADHELVRAKDGLILLLAPPFDHSQPSPGYIQGYVPGTRENGGQYTHAALWLILAHVLRGDGDEAHALYQLISPINHARTREAVDRYKVEPYVVAADVYAHPMHLGRGGWTWYTGSASWMYRVGLEGLLGVRRRGARLTIDPCIPHDWPGYRLTYRYGATRYEVQVDNPAGQCRGVAQVELDGHRLSGGEVELVDDGQVHQIHVTLGQAQPLPA